MATKILGRRILVHWQAAVFGPLVEEHGFTPRIILCKAVLIRGVAEAETHSGREVRLKVEKQDGKQ
jgi:hypothetical protein